MLKWFGGVNPLHPSGASRWLVCPQSVVETYTQQTDEGSIYASEGTTAHEEAASCLVTGVDPEDPRLRQYTDFVRSRPGFDSRNVEYKVTLAFLLGEGGGGTVDSWAYDPSRKLLIVNDLKWGKGVPVSAIENPQLLLYALGLRKEVNKPVATIQLNIIQPRRGGINNWNCTSDYLMTFHRQVCVAVKKIHDAIAFGYDLAYKPGMHQCIFCPFGFLCPERGSFTTRHELSDSERLKLMFNE